MQKVLRIAFEAIISPLKRATFRCSAAILLVACGHSVHVSSTTMACVGMARSLLSS